MPVKQKMAVSFKSLMSSVLGGKGTTAGPAPLTELFTKTDPAVDGDECLHDCEGCSIKYPRNFKIEEDDLLYGHVSEWATHLLVATSKTDWVRDSADEKGSVMEAVSRAQKPTNGVRRPFSFFLCPCLSYHLAKSYAVKPRIRIFC